MDGWTRSSSSIETLHTSIRPTSRLVGRLALVIVLVSLLAVAPAAAQSNAANPVCQDDSGTLANMIEGFIQITTGLGIMGLLVVWQADTLMSMFTMSREQKADLKEHRRGAMRSAIVLVVLGPLFTVAGSAMGLPIASCVNLIPF
ncbi:hypothetical protein [Halorarius halobius]|uniref:hypothetical protein n=1 Tax=Halorarius halobius TaxID=2962671 RepID=UPI0020CE9A1C|nr:hypothetical protein [Halorarius halobius]